MAEPGMELYEGNEGRLVWLKGGDMRLGGAAAAVETGEGASSKCEAAVCGGTRLPAASTAAANVPDLASVYPTPSCNLVPCEQSI